MITYCFHDRFQHNEMKIANYLIENNIYDVNFKSNERIRYYVDRNIGNLINKQKYKNNKYSLIKYSKINKDKSKIIKNFPENKPKFSLIKNDS